MTTLDKKKGWSNSGNLKTGNRSLEVSVQANFQEYPETYCIEFTKSGNTASNLPIRAEAYITWSVEGNFVTRRVSISNGTTVQGVAQAVRVVIKDVTEANADTPGSPVPNEAEYTVSVQITRGSRGSNSFPPFLVPPDCWFRELGVGATLDIEVPQDAGITSVLLEYVGFDGANYIGAENLIRMTMRQNAVRINRCVIENGKLYPMAPGTQQISLNVLNLVDPTVVIVYVSIYFGIDG